MQNEDFMLPKAIKNFFRETSWFGWLRLL